MAVSVYTGSEWRKLGVTNIYTSNGWQALFPGDKFYCGGNVGWVPLDSDCSVIWGGDLSLNIVDIPKYPSEDAEEAELPLQVYPSSGSVFFYNYHYHFRFGHGFWDDNTRVCILKDNKWLNVPYSVHFVPHYSSYDMNIYDMDNNPLGFTVHDTAVAFVNLPRRVYITAQSSLTDLIYLNEDLS
ncbi:MAG: hypothetical protein IKA87_00730 [Lentisphaeria bacterium]|nr:hypothetical protein [Lentisphaeria bacterium]